MNNFSRIFQAVIGPFIIPKHMSAYVVNNFLKGFIHVFGLFTFIVRPFVVKSKYWNPVFVFGVWVYFTIIIDVGNRFATPSKINGRSVVFFYFFANAISITSHFQTKEFIQAVVIKTKTIHWGT